MANDRIHSHYTCIEWTQHCTMTDQQCMYMYYMLLLANMTITQRQLYLTHSHTHTLFLYPVSYQYMVTGPHPTSVWAASSPSTSKNAPTKAHFLPAGSSHTCTLCTGSAACSPDCRRAYVYYQHTLINAICHLVAMKTKNCMRTYITQTMVGNSLKRHKQPSIMWSPVYSQWLAQEPVTAARFPRVDVGYVWS